MTLSSMCTCGHAEQHHQKHLDGVRRQCMGHAFSPRDGRELQSICPCRVFERAPDATLAQDG